MQFVEDFRKKEIPVGWLLSGVMLFGVAAYAASLIRAANGIEVRTEFAVGLSGDSVVFKVRPTVVNPTNTTLNISFPNAKVYLNKEEFDKGSAFGVSVPQNKNYTVIPKGTTTLDWVELPVQYMQVPALLQLCKKDTIELYVKVDVPVNLNYGITTNASKIVKQVFPVPALLKRLALLMP